MNLVISLIFLLEAVFLAVVLTNNPPRANQEVMDGVTATAVTQIVGQAEVGVRAVVPRAETVVSVPPEVEETLTEKVSLTVPFVTEAPEGNWKSPWINACEEASMVMVEGYYAGKSEIEPAEAADKMRELFAYQNEVWGSNANSDAARTVKIIEDNFAYGARAVINPTKDDIKAELRAGRPVISLHYGKDLQNKNVPFATYGSYYHMIVVTGYDDATQEFITNDDGDEKTGFGYRYGYDLFMRSLHDYNFATKKTDLPATVIFTEKK